MRFIKPPIFNGIIAAASLFLTVIILTPSCSDAKQELFNQPNVILIFADDMGYGDLGTYGNPTILTLERDTPSFMSQVQYVVQAGLAYYLAATPKGLSCTNMSSFPNIPMALILKRSFCQNFSKAQATKPLVLASGI